MEWDVRQVAGAEREDLKRFIALFKEHRDLIHSGRMVRADVPDESLMLHGAVSAESPQAGTTAALFALVSTRTAFAEQPGKVTIPGLEPDRTYRMEAISPVPGDSDYAHTFTQVQPPAWLAEGAVANGRFLAEVGVPMPILNPEHALLLRFTAL